MNTFSTFTFVDVGLSKLNVSCSMLYHLIIIVMEQMHFTTPLTNFKFFFQKDVVTLFSKVFEFFAETIIYSHPEFEILPCALHYFTAK